MKPSSEMSLRFLSDLRIKQNKYTPYPVCACVLLGYSPLLIHPLSEYSPEGSITFTPRNDKEGTKVTGVFVEVERVFAPCDTFVLRNVVNDRFRQ